jgi:hypothetical protein
MSDFDGCWKEALDLFFRGFLAFFFPEAHADIDWTVDYESLEQELRQLAPGGEAGKRLADKLVKVSKRGSGDPAYIHVEVQNQRDDGLDERNRRYNDRAQDRYNQPVVTLVVLGDPDPDWRPGHYHFAQWGFRKSLEFPTVKLLDYRGRAAELEAEANPFGLLVRAHLLALDTRRDEEARAAGKLRLIRGLYERGLDAEDIRHWYRLLDWLLDLPEEMERRVWAEIARFEEEKRVPHISFAERYGMEKGRKEGLEEGQREYLLKGIELGLDLKFGAAGLQLLPTIQAQADLAVLQRVFESIKPAGSVDELRRLLPANGAPSPADPARPADGRG